MSAESSVKFSINKIFSVASCCCCLLALVVKRKISFKRLRLTLLQFFIQAFFVLLRWSLAGDFSYLLAFEIPIFFFFDKNRLACSVSGGELWPDNQGEFLSRKQAEKNVSNRVFLSLRFVFC